MGELAQLMNEVAGVKTADIKLCAWNEVVQQIDGLYQEQPN